MLTNNFTLLLLGCQNDIVQNTKNSDEMINELCVFINNNAEHIERVIIAMDNHDAMHPSFSRYGGYRNAHCIEGTQGAKIDNRIIELLEQLSLDYRYLNKGETSDIDEVSASTFSNYHDGKFVLRTITDACKIPTDDIVVFGIDDETITETLNHMVKQIDNSDNIHVLIGNNVGRNYNMLLRFLENNPDVQIEVERC